MKQKIRLFKTLDPVFQSLLFVLFTFCLSGTLPYMWVFATLFIWQLVSAIAHTTFRRTTMLKKQRKYHLIVAAVYVVIFIAVSFLLPERYFVDRSPEGIIKLPIHQILLVAVGMGVSFWYSVICFREIRRIYKKVHAIEE